MTFHLLNINQETAPSILLGQTHDRDGTPVTVLYELQEGRHEDILPFLDLFLEQINKALGLPMDAVVLTYQKLRYSGIWYKHRPVVEAQDAQSLDFMGFDADEYRDAARHIEDLTVMPIQLAGLAKATGKQDMLLALAQLWDSSNDVPDFKAKVMAWTPKDAA